MTSIENLPIDIHYNKLLDWLVNRRHCDQQWQKSILSIRQKINAALQDMPPVEEVTQLLHGTFINSYHCEKIVSLLKDTESDTKNLFGQYSSKRMKDWQEIAKLYEKDGVGLAEAAQLLTRNVNYEVPAVKKQIAKAQQTQKDCVRKEAEYLSNSADLRNKYNTTCKQIGIQGKKIKSELSCLVQDLPQVYLRISEQCGTVQTAIDYYKAFVEFTINSDVSSGVLPMVCYVCSHGNTTVYQWRTGSKPDTVEEVKIYIDTTDEQDSIDNQDTIDWGGADAEKEVVADIDFGDDIDFDITDITVESGGTEITGDAPPSTLQNDGVARGEDALSILDNPATRAAFINDLVELESFLCQRRIELEGEESTISGSQFQSAPPAVQVDAKTVVLMEFDVQAILQQLTSVQMQHLMLIRNSPRYVERLKDTLQQTMHLSEKMVFYQKQAVEKRETAVEEEHQLEPALQLLIRKTKELQKNIEAEISKKYKSRPVNIMGEINTM